MSLAKNQLLCVAVSRVSIDFDVCCVLVESDSEMVFDVLKLWPFDGSEVKTRAWICVPLAVHCFSMVYDIE